MRTNREARRQAAHQSVGVLRIGKSSRWRQHGKTLRDSQDVEWKATKRAPWTVKAERRTKNKAARLARRANR